MTETATKTVLVIEDNEVERDALAAALADRGYSVKSAANGKKGIDYLHSHRADLIVLDMLMPKLDGWGVLRELEKRGIGVPVIITTATVLNPEWARQHGCVGLLRKPFDMPALVAEVERCLGDDLQ